MADIPKIFGIGLSKTGTTSLGLALNRLGIRTIDYPQDLTTLRELEQGQFNLSVLQDYQAVTDTPVAVYYAQLDRIYPRSKFILTVRDKESWLRSVEEHWKFSEEWAKRHIAFKRFSYFMHVAVYGVYAFERERFSFVYDQHVRSVMDYFRDRPRDLLVLEVCGGEGYEKLCPFLGLPALDEPFPRANTKGEKAQRRAWMRQLDEAAAALANIVRGDEAILLLDEGQLGGTTTLAKRNVIPFPERRGDYAGRPSNGEEAAASFHRLLRERKPGYFVIAWNAFWWLEHYPQLRSSLAPYRRVLADENLIIFDLRRKKAAQEPSLLEQAQP